MHTDPKVALLKTVPSLARYSNRHLARIASLLDDIDVAAGALVARHSQVHPELVIVVAGTAVVSSGSSPPTVARPGDVVVHLPRHRARLGDPGGPATIVAAEPMRVLVAAPAAVATLLADERMRAAASRLQPVSPLPSLSPPARANAA